LTAFFNMQSFLPESFSQYCGLFTPYQTPEGWNLYKAIHSLQLFEEVQHIDVGWRSWKVTYDSTQIEYYTHTNGVLCVQVSKDVTLPLFADCRPIYDYDDHGRWYSYNREGDLHIISYHKENAQLENGSSNIHYIVFVADQSVELHDHWIQQYYSYDKKRGSKDSLYVYHPCSFTGSGKIIVACGFDLEQTKKRLRDVQVNDITYRKNDSQVTQQEVYLGCPQDPAESCALQYAVNAMNQLTCNNHDNLGLYAGLPWFFQFWTRDEAIGLSGLFVTGQYQLAKQILTTRLKVLDDGRLPNRFPHADLGSADGVGWVCKRMYDLLHCIDPTSYFTFDELRDIRSIVTESIMRIESTYMKNGLIYNKPLETWMDTGSPYDERAGYRVEIQALFAIQLRLVNYITELVGEEKHEFVQKELDFRKTVVSQLFDECLWDGLTADGELDKTIRPNVFIAYYVYPWLCSHEEWEVTFDRCIKELYLPWGGLSTISKSHPLFKEYHTGQSNESYHRGDSWYFINNMAGYCLYEFDSHKYSDIVDSIIRASTQEILTCGAVGCHAEITDAASITSYGCFSQLWSNAQFIELVKAVRLQ